MVLQRVAERRERLRDDPYYIMDDKPSTSKRVVDDDIDSIPVVRLDDMPSLAGWLRIFTLSIFQS
jgi:AP-3 complex subunit delta-1